MKFFIFLSLITFQLAFAQQQYHKVELQITPEQMLQLQQEGVCFDHYEYKQGKITGDFSDWEMNKIQQSQVPFEVLLRNVSEHYRNHTYYSSTEYRGLQACINDFADSSLDPANYFQGNNGWFLTYNEMLAELDKMRMLYPNLISAKQPINSLRTHEGRPIYWVRISDNPDIDENETEGLITGIHHAREVVCVTTCTYFMWYLLENYTSNTSIRNMVDNSELYIVLNMNPDGYVYNETTNPNGGGMWRKNRRNNGDGTYGVDLNRNYGYQWGLNNGSSPTPGSDIYRGPSAFSEPETQMIRDFCNAHQFRLALNFHTFSDRLIHPWGYTSVNTSDYANFVKLGEDLTRDSYYYYATAPFAVGYSVSGSSDDWMYGEQTSKPKIFAMTPEVGEAEWGFWPDPSFVLPYARQNLQSLLNFTSMLSGYFDVEENSSMFVNTLNPMLQFYLKNYSMNTNSASLNSVNFLSGNVISNGTLPQNITQLSFAVNNPTLNLNLSPTISSGSLVEINTNWSNNVYAKSKNIKKYYNINTTIKNDNGNNFNNVSTYNFFQISNTTYNSSPSSFKAVAQTGTGYSSLKYDNIDLTNCTMAFMELYSKTEATSKYEQLHITVNGEVACMSDTKKGINDVELDTYKNSAYWGTTIGFKRFNIDLTPYIGQFVNIEINVSNSNPSGGTVYIDDVKIMKQASNPASIVDYNSIENKSNSMVLTNQPIDLSSRFAKIKQVMLTDITGKILLQQVSPIVNANFLHNGNYYLTIKTETGLHTYKCIRL